MKRLNPYFIFLSLYGLLIFPLNLHFTMRLGKAEEESGYRLQYELIGLKTSGRKKKKTSAPMNPFRLQKETLTALFKNRSALFKAGKLTRLEFRALLATGDAAKTALLFSGLRAFFTGLMQAGRLPFAFRYHLAADFESNKSRLELEGIISLRLGMLMTAFIRVYVHRFWLLLQKEKRASALKGVA